MDAAVAQQAEAQAMRESSPTKSAQDVLRRMSLNSPPSRADNPRQVKRVKLLAGEASVPFAIPQAAAATAASAAQTPATVRKLAPPSSRASALDRPSPMPSWGVNLRDASAGETLEADDRDPHDPSAFYPSFQLDCLRQPYGDPSSSGGGVSPGSPTSTAMDDDDDDDDDYDDGGDTNASLRFMREAGAGDHGQLPCPSPARLEMKGKGLEGIAAALEEARGNGGGGAGVPETPCRRPGSGARSRVVERSAEGAADGSCSPVGGYGGRDGLAEQGSPVKKRGVGRWRLSEEGRRDSADRHQLGGGGGGGGGGFGDSPLRSNRNPFSPNGDGRRRSSDQGDAMSMPAPAPRSRISSRGTGGVADGSPMDTGDVVDVVDFGAKTAGGKGDEGSFLRRVSLGSCASVPSTGGKKPVLDATNPSPCDVTAFMPITPCRSSTHGEGFSSMETGRGGGDGVSLSPITRVVGGTEVPVVGGDGARGRFATDFEVKEDIGAGTFGTVYKARRVDGCLYAVKCSRRRFKGELDRQKMLMEVYALAAVCDSAQETINIVRYHQAWIEDERLYIQTELCETSLEKQLDSGHRLEIDGVYAFLRQTLLGLDTLHQHKLVHLDIKPGNIFVKNGQYKLGDFGLVTPVHVRSGADVLEGDSRYMSKELLNDDHSNLTKCDVFSLGITLYEIISGRPLPPNGEEWHSLRSGKVGMPMGLPAELSTTLQQMMHPDPSRRPSAAELLRIPCLQSEMEKQLNDQKSKLSKERTRNSGLLEEVSALIQKQSSQRSGRLSRTITWDNSYFAATGAKGASSLAKGLGGTPDRGGSGMGMERARFNPSPFKANASGFFAGGFESAPGRFGPAGTPAAASAAAAAAATAGGGGGGAGSGFGQGIQGLSSLDEKEEEEGAGSPMTEASSPIGRGFAGRPGWLSTVSARWLTGKHESGVGGRKLGHNRDFIVYVWSRASALPGTHELEVGR
ncbi:unnamed protein product [Pylaiella littoralis]